MGRGRFSFKKTSCGIIKESILYSAIRTFNTYEEYLDSMITKEDIYYLEDLQLARQLVELGIINHGNSAIIPRTLFNTKQRMLHRTRFQNSDTPHWQRDRDIAKKQDIANNNQILPNSSRQTNTRQII